MDKEKIEEIESKIEYTFRNKKNLIKAFTHTSASNENKGPYGNYEDLAKFGDRILNFIVSDKLYLMGWINEIETGHERKNNYINNENIMKRAKALGIEPISSFLVLGEGSKSDPNIDQSEKIYGDVIEALIAAIYIDSGRNLNKARRFILEKLEVIEIDQEARLRALQRINDDSTMNIKKLKGYDTKQLPHNVIDFNAEAKSKE